MMLDTLLRKVLQIAGVPLTERSNWNIVRGASAIDNTITKATDITIDGESTSVAVTAYDIDWSAGRVFTKTLGAGAQVFTFSHALSGRTVRVRVTGAASTLTWPTVKWPSGVSPTQTASGTDIYTFVHDGTSIYGSVSPDNS